MPSLFFASTDACAKLILPSIVTGVRPAFTRRGGALLYVALGIEYTCSKARQLIEKHHYGRRREELEDAEAAAAEW